MSVKFSFTLPASSVAPNTPTVDPLLGNSKVRSQRCIADAIDNLYSTLTLFFKNAELTKLITTKDGRTYYDLYGEFILTQPSASLRSLTKQIFAALAFNIGLKARAQTVAINDGELIITVQYDAVGITKSVTVETKTAFTVFKSSL